MQSILSNFPSQRLGNQPKKLLHIGFDGLTIGTPTRSGSDTNWISTVTGTNSRGYSFPASVVAAFGAGSSTYVQSIPEGGITAGDLTTFESKFTNVIQDRTFSVYDSMSGKELSLSCDVRDTIGLGGQTFTNPQTDFLVNIGTAAALADPVREYYIRMDCFVPAGLTTQTGDTGSGNFWLFIDIKHGGYNNLNGVGDLRHIVSITNNGGVDAYTASIDDDANGRGVIPALSVGGIPGTALPKTTFLNIRSPATVRTGVKHVVHMYVKYPVGGRSDTETGIYTVVIEPEGYDPVVVCDVHGAGYTMAGVEELPPTRFHIGLNYTSAILPNPIIIGNIEIWNKPPRHIGKLEVGNFGPLPWVPTPLSRATYYVSPTGLSGNDGSIGSPKTFQSALNAALPDDVIIMRAGTYSITSAANLNIWAEGTEANPIIIECYPGEAVVIDGSTINPGVDTTRNSNISGWYQVIRGIAFKNMPEYGTFLTGHHNRLQHCEIAYNRLSGAITYQSGSPPWDPLKSSYNLLESCWIHHNSDVGLFGGNYDDGGNADGVSFSTGIGNQARHCLIEYNSDDGADSWRSKDSQFKYCIIRYNGLGNGNGNGVKAGGNTEGEGCIVNHNLVYGNLNNGIAANTGIDVDISSNTTWDNGGVGYVFEPTTAHERNVSIGDGSTHTGTGVPGLPNSWDLTGTPTFISTTEGNADFLKVTQDGTFDDLGAGYL